MTDTFETLVAKLVKKCQESNARPEKCFLNGETTCKYRSEKKRTDYIDKRGNPHFGYDYECNK